MKENFIKGIQKFLNMPFKYRDLLIFLDKQKDFLLRKDILEKTEEAEYNALWDVITELESFFVYAKGENMTIGVEMSVNRLFEYNYKKRNERNKK